MNRSSATCWRWYSMLRPIRDASGGQPDYDVSAYDTNDAVNRTWGTGCTEFYKWVPGYTEGELAFSGTQKATWLASDPWLPDKIVLHQSTEFSGYNLTLGFPPTWERYENTISWHSEPISGVWYTQATRPNNSVKWTILFGNLTNAVVTDTADIYVTKSGITRIYRPQSEIDIFG